MMVGKRFSLNVETQKCKRFDNIDLLESIAMLFVVIYHIPSDLNYDILCPHATKAIFNYVVYGVLSVCVPLFFLCNGFLLFQKRMDLRRHLKKTSKLVVLSMVWSIIYLLLYFFLNNKIDELRLTDVLSVLCDTTIYINNSIWYLHTLVVIYLLFPALKIVYDVAPKVFNYVVLVVSVSLLAKYFVSDLATLITHNHFEKYNIWGNFNPVNMPHSYALLYFLVGGIMTRLVLVEGNNNVFIISKLPLTIHISVLVAKGLLILVLVICITTIGFYGIYVSKLDGQIYEHVFRGYGSIPTIISTICLFLLFLNYQSKNYMIKSSLFAISSQSLGIYFFHIVVLRVLFKYFKQDLQMSHLLDNHWGVVMLAFIVLAISLCLTRLVEIFPFTRGLVRL